MKSFKQFNETVERRRSPDENRFIDKHVVDKKEHPVAKDDQFVAKNKKDKTKAASYKDGQDKEVYEEVELDEATATVKQQKALKALMTKALGGKRAKPGTTSAIATNGDFVVKDGGSRIIGRIKAGEFQDPLKEEIERRADVKMVKVKLPDGKKVMRKQRPEIKIGEEAELELEEKDTHKTKDGRTAKKGLYYNIMMKKKRGEKPAPKGDPDRPSEQDFKNAEKTAKEEVELDEGVIDDLRKIVKTKSAKDVKFAGGGKTKVDMFTASAMVKVHDALNDANKKKFADAINKNENMFMKMMDFAMSKVK